MIGYNEFVMKTLFQKLCVFSLLLAGYLFFHLYQPTKLPVFADEAIYIRWAQLIIDDWQQYLFFPLNDGKTPLFIWSLIPFLLIVKDQLLAGRLLSIFIGAAQGLITYTISRKIKISTHVSLIAGLFTTITPYWYFHHHLALMDGMLTFWLSCALLFTIQLLAKIHKTASWKKILPSALGLGLVLGLAILTKIPAILFFFGIIVLAFCLQSQTLIQRLKTAGWLSLAFLLALIVFLTLKTQPIFSQLFTRGSDFLFSWQEIVFEHKWKDTLPSWPTYLGYFYTYLTWPVLLLGFLSPFLTKKRMAFTFHLMTLSYLVPIMLLGRVVFARYLFSACLPLVLSAVLTIEHLIHQGSKFVKYVTFLLLLWSLILSLQFIIALQTAPQTAQFVSSDVKQYLTEWSAGYGVKESALLIKNLASNQNVFIICEGYFGTLPDGLLMYFHRTNVDRLYIEPIGQPIVSLNRQFHPSIDAAKQILLVANSNRIQLDLKNSPKLLEICRPFHGACHQIFDVTALIHR